MSLNSELKEKIELEGRGELSEYELSELVPRYYTNNTEMKKYKKLADADNKKIKEVMNLLNLTEYEVGGITAKISVSKRVDLLEDVLMEKIKVLGVEGIIKTKEYIDMDALEDALYHGRISPATLAQAQVEKEVVTLRVNKKKAK